MTASNGFEPVQVEAIGSVFEISSNLGKFLPAAFDPSFHVDWRSDSYPVESHSVSAS